MSRYLLICGLFLFTNPFVLATETTNIILIVADDLGYGDLGCFGSQTKVTPRIDAIARQGTKFTNFYVSQAVCSASRASLMTGCYANRVGLAGALNHTSPAGVNPQETLLSELLQQQGYATGIFGKWHLGLPPTFHPHRHGFAHWEGIPYSNDNSKYHPALAAEMPPLPWFSDQSISETDPDQSQFTERLTQNAVDFVKRHPAKPFFLYVPYIMPHVPIFASPKFNGHTGHGLYADVLAEMDAGVGRILDALAETKLEGNTWIIFISDNGPFLSYGEHAGSAGALREGKLTCFEGGIRIPCLMRWPGKITENSTCEVPLMTIDLLPTIAKVVGASLPNHRIDGLDVLPVLQGQSDSSPHEAFAFYSGDELHAIRSGRWKLHLPHPYLTVNGTPGRGGKPAGYEKLKPQSIEQSGVSGIASRHGYRVAQQPLALYDLSLDVGETKNVAQEHPDIVDKLMKYAEAYRLDLGDSLTGQRGTGLRDVGKSN